jgi:hypothetical protein
MLVYSAPKALTLINIDKVTVLNDVYGIKLKFKVDWKSTDEIYGYFETTWKYNTLPTTFLSPKTQVSHHHPYF